MKKSYYNYDVYGKLGRSTVNVNIPYRFTGQEFACPATLFCGNFDMNLHNFRARMYDDSIAMFYAVDPAHSTSSPYGYANQNPVSFVDPTGMVDQYHTTAYLNAQQRYLAEMRAWEGMKMYNDLMGISSKVTIFYELAGGDVVMRDFGASWNDAVYIQIDRTITIEYDYNTYTVSGPRNFATQKAGDLYGALMEHSRAVAEYVLSRSNLTSIGSSDGSDDPKKGDFLSFAGSKTSNNPGFPSDRDIFFYQYDQVEKFISLEAKGCLASLGLFLQGASLGAAYGGATTASLLLSVGSDATTFMDDKYYGSNFRNTGVNLTLTVAGYSVPRKTSIGLGWASLIYMYSSLYFGK